MCECARLELLEVHFILFQMSRLYQRWDAMEPLWWIETTAAWRDKHSISIIFGIARLECDPIRFNSMCALGGTCTFLSLKIHIIPFNFPATSTRFWAGAMQYLFDGVTCRQLTSVCMLVTSTWVCVLCGGSVKLFSIGRDTRRHHSRMRIRIETHFTSS